MRLEQIDKRTVLPSGYRDRSLVIGFLSANPGNFMGSRNNSIVTELRNFVSTRTDLTSAKWSVIANVSQFVDSPTKSSLADIVRTFPETRTELKSGYLEFPWPVASIVKDYCEGEISSADLALEVEQGAFGDYDDWVQAEKRWNQNGITQTDIRAWKNGRYLNPDIAKVGAPPIEPFSLREENYEIDNRYASQLLELANEFVGSRKLNVFVDLVNMIFANVREPSLINGMKEFMLGAIKTMDKWQIADFASVGSDNLSKADTSYKLCRKVLMLGYGQLLAYRFLKSIFLTSGAVFCRL